MDFRFFFYICFIDKISTNKKGSAVKMKNCKKIVCAICALLLAAVFAGCAMAENLAANEFVGENAYGAGGVIRVKVTMDGDKIAKIKVLEQHETRGLGTTAIMKLTDEIVKNNTTEVDIIAGATLTSVSFAAAVRQAVETALNTDPTAGIELGENEYLGLSNNALGGRLMIKVTLDGEKMTAIDVLENHESAEIGGVALAAQLQKILDANSAEVDNIAGATITCKALAEAVTMALESAK